MADLTIVVDVHEVAPGKLQTMSSYSIPPSGKLVYRNGADSGAGNLVITAKAPTTKLPFCDSSGKHEITIPPISPQGEETVHICKGFSDDFFYTARIGTTAIPEDPIVIIEKKLNVSPDPVSMLLLGLGIGAGLTYLIVKSRANKMRPQQG